MSGYFKQFPRITYTLADKNVFDRQMVTNIFARSTFLREVVDNTAAYYEYDIKDGETPEIIADKLYGDPNRHWVVLLFNQILNPFYSFPLRSEALDSYVISKYGTTLGETKSNIHHYELRVNKTLSQQGTIVAVSLEKFIVGPNEVDYSTGKITPRTLPETADTGITIETEVVMVGDNTIETVLEIWAVSNYIYEEELNESRRKIKLLDKQYIFQVEKEFKSLMSV